MTSPFRLRVFSRRWPVRERIASVDDHVLFKVKAVARRRLDG
jgi:hypothetical protein